MKHLLLLIGIILTLKSVFSQSDTTSYYFKEVGMSLKVSSKFEMVDEAEDERLRKKGEKLIEDANEVQIDASSTKNLLSIKQGQFNYMNITVTPYQQSIDSDWKNENKEMKNMLHKSFADKVSSNNVDTASLAINVDGIMFDRFEITIRINSSKTMKLLLLSKYYKGYDFGICYAYLDEEIGKELENIVSNAKFKK